MTVERPNRRRIDMFNDMWEEDAPFSTLPGEIVLEQSKNYAKIAKYERFWTEEDRRYREMLHNTETLRFRLTRLYRDGPQTKEEHETIKRMGWEMPPEGRALKGELKQWVDINPTMYEAMMELGEQANIVEMLKDVIATLQQRNVTLSSAAKQQRYEMGED